MKGVRTMLRGLSRALRMEPLRRRDFLVLIFFYLFLFVFFTFTGSWILFRTDAWALGGIWAASLAGFAFLYAVWPREHEPGGWRRGFLSGGRRARLRGPGGGWTARGRSLLRAMANLDLPVDGAVKGMKVEEKLIQSNRRCERAMLLLLFLLFFCLSSPLVLAFLKRR
jgi:hypothetical protein